MAELYKNKNVSADARAEDLLNRMSFAEKVSQLVGYIPAAWADNDIDSDYPLGVGQVSLLMGSDKESIYQVADFQRKLQKKIMKKSPHQIPAIFHVETLCGVMLPDAQSFPSGIGQGATFDPEQQEEVGRLIGKQARAAGASQALAPVLDISRDSRFGRQGETYGEDPTLTSSMGCAYIKGLQQNGRLEKAATATAKHFLGYHDAQGGIHAAACDIPERLLREIYAKPFQAAITESELHSIMPCYSSVNGVPVAASAAVLKKLLVEEMGFAGLVISDYSAIQEIHERHHVGESCEAAGIMALKAGIHQELPEQKCYTEISFAKHINDQEFMKCLNVAVRKVLIEKFRLGLFENPFAAQDDEIQRIYECSNNQRVALKSALESIVLIKNNGILPLRKKRQTIAVIGYHAMTIRALFGGYTFASMIEGELGAGNTMAGIKKNSAQESEDTFVYHGTVVEREHPDAERIVKKFLPSVKNLFEEFKLCVPETNFLYAYGYPYTGDDCSAHADALAVAEQAEIIIMTVGGKYGTGTTASMGEGIDGTDINLPQCQEKLIEKIAKKGKSIILLHFGGRPISSNAADLYADAIIEVWNPGSEGAEAITRVLFGDYNPAGRLPLSVPYNAGQIPVYYNHPYGSSYHQNTISAFRQYMDCPHVPRYYFGHGLSYTTFSYTKLHISQKYLYPDEMLDLTFEVENVGDFAGDEVVQVYVRDCFSSMVRPVQELVGFKRTHFKKGQKKSFRFHMNLSQVAFLDNDMKWKIESGEMELLIGTSSNDIRLTDRFIIQEDAYIEGKTRSFFGSWEIN